jgi:AAA domain
MSETSMMFEDLWRAMDERLTEVVNSTIDAAMKKISAPALAQPGQNGTKPQPQEFFDFLEFTDLKNRPAPEYLVYGMLPTRGICWLIGPSGEGKTYFSVGLGVAVAAGFDWMKRKTRHKHVVYIAAEDIDEVAQRFIGCALYHKLQDIPNLHVYKAPIQLIRDTPKLIESIKHKYGDIDIGLFIIDTQAMCTLGVNENTKHEFDAITMKLELLWRTFKCCVLSVHHTGRNGEMRGTSSMDGVAYSIIKVNKVDGYVRVHCEKSRRGRDFEDFYLSWETVELPGLVDEMGKQVTTSVLVPTSTTVVNDPTKLTDLQQTVLDSIKSLGGTDVPRTTVMKDCGIDPNKDKAFNNAIKTLVSKHLITKKTEKQHTTYDLFTTSNLSEEDRAALARMGTDKP